MKKRTILRSIVTSIILSSAVMCKAQSNYLERMIQIPDEKGRIEFISSLNSSQVWTMANQAFEAGWDSYAVGAGIIGSYYGLNWEKNTPNYKELLAVVTNKSMNLALRGSLAASGMELADRWSTADFLTYYDKVISFAFRNESLDTSSNCRILEYARRGIVTELKNIQNSDATEQEKVQNIAEVHRRIQRSVEMLLNCLNERNGLTNANRDSMKLALKEYAQIYDQNGTIRDDIKQKVITILGEEVFK